MKRLVTMTTDLALQNTAHIADLANASRHTSQIVQSLQNAALSVSTLQEVSLALSRDAQQSRSSRRGIFSLWPLAVCPSAVLILGSYGLQPSMARNLGLLALGEALGTVVWVADAGADEKKRMAYVLAETLLGNNRADWMGPAEDKDQTVVALVNEKLTRQRATARRQTEAGIEAALGQDQEIEHPSKKEEGTSHVLPLQS